MWGAVEVFDTWTGQIVYTLTLAEANSEVHFVENDTKILLGQGPSTQLWDLRTGRLIQNFETGKPFWWVVAVDMSPDKRFIASGHDNVNVWEMTSGALTHEVSIGAPVSFISFSLFICSEHAIQHNKLFDNGRVTTEYRNLHKYKFKNYTTSNNRSVLAAWVFDFGELEAHINLYDTQTGQVIWRHQADVQLHVVSVSDKNHTISIFSKSLFQIIDYTSSSLEMILAHNLPSFHLDSVFILSDHQHVAYHHSDNSGLFIHHHHHLESSVSFQGQPNLSRKTGCELSMSITVNLSDLLDYHFYHLHCTSPSYPRPSYKPKSLLDDQGWLTDNKQKKIYGFHTIPVPDIVLDGLRAGSL